MYMYQVDDELQTDDLVAIAMTHRRNKYAICSCLLIEHRLQRGDNPKLNVPDLLTEITD